MKTIEAGGSPAPARVAVWDLPTRLVHWLLAGLIGFSWWSAEQGHIEWHFYSGYAVLTLLLFRLMWGFVGSSTARFANFVRGPSAVLGYVRNVREWRGIGHNPLGAASVVVLLAAIAFQVATGLIGTDDDGLVEGPLAPLVGFDVSDLARELHEDSFDVLLVLILVHVAAIVVYRLVFGKRLVAPMITGIAEVEPSTQPIRPARQWLALACLVAAVAITRWIIAGAPPFGP